ncbi:MAG: ribonuclease E/G, partial [Myxococcota bacterium]
DHQRIREFVASFAPEAAGRIELYAGPEPIFDHFGIEVELERALERRVWLKSGGYIVIDEAEALTAIDVNSGRFVGQSSLEDTITQINLEAVKEVAFQLRLRNIGGIVIIDFIDMTEAQNREKVLGAIEEALKHDKAKTTVVRMSEIGLVEMTRKRVRESLRQVLTETCPYCKGRSFIKSEQTVANEILRSLVRALAGSPSPRVLVNMEPTIADCLYAAQTAEVERIEARFGTQVIPVAREGYHREHFEIVQTRGRP